MELDKTFGIATRCTYGIYSSEFSLFKWNHSKHSVTSAEKVLNVMYHYNLNSAFLGLEWASEGVIEKQKLEVLLNRVCDPELIIVLEKTLTLLEWITLLQAFITISIPRLCPSRNVWSLSHNRRVANARKQRGNGPRYKSCRPFHFCNNSKTCWSPVSPSVTLPFVPIGDVRKAI